MHLAKLKRRFCIRVSWQSQVQLGSRLPGQFASLQTIQTPDRWLEQIGQINRPFSSQFAMTTYYYVLASEKFLTQDEPLEEVLRERTRDYLSKEKEIDFWLVPRPVFLEAPEMAEIKARCPQPATAIVSTNKQFITWLKLRLEYVITGEFQTSESIPDPLASLAPAT
jgi:hypothetical protein